jgi:hypothetical protein
LQEAETPFFKEAKPADARREEVSAGLMFACRSGFFAYE